MKETNAEESSMEKLEKNRIRYRRVEKMMIELTRLPKIEFERVPETYNKCSTCYRYIYNGYAQCHGPESDCVLHNYRYYQPIYRVKEEQNNE